uniref:Uncharacterized protein n=1 Tax=Tanacetum cinerariifolium TaxID=118510 RepID=A0A6L2MBI6_TANCI|nr:hypothetical protein [Tanacetum cinerariifolium]
MLFLKKSSPLEDKVCKFGVSENETYQLHYDTLATSSIHSKSIIDWSLFANHGLNGSFFQNINTDTLFEPQWVNLFQINKPVYRELVHEFFTSIEFEATAYREYNTRSGLRRAVTKKAEHLLMDFWPTIRDGEFVVGGTSVKKVRDPRVRLAIVALQRPFQGVVCNIPYSLARYLKGIKVMDLICGGMFVTRLAQSFRILIRDYYGARWRACYWLVTRQVTEDDEVEEANEEGAGGL